MSDSDIQSALYLITAPAAATALVSLAEMKQHLSVDHSDHDDLIESYMAAALGQLDGPEGDLNRAIGEQTWELRLSGWPCGGLVRIPLPPLIEVVSVKYRDEDEVEQTFDEGDYHVLGAGNAISSRGRIQIGQDVSWPALASGWPEPIVIQFRAGFIDGSSPAQPAVPVPILQAMKLITGNWYAHRETYVIGQTVVEIPGAADSLLRRYRVFD